MNQRLKKFIINNVSLGTYLFLNKLKDKVRGFDKLTLNVNDIFHIISKTKKDIFFIQIGSNDGITNDPIHPFIKQYGWKGILVEPVPGIFAQLKKNYQDVKDLIFENVGIGDKAESKDFFCLPEEMNEPGWLQQIGTFDQNAFIKNAEVIPGIVEKMMVKQFRLITLKELFIRNNVQSVDILNIDAEGYEYKILQQLDSVEMLPYLLLFEWGSMSEKDLLNTLSYLQSKGYSIYYSGGDMVGLLN